jgi:peptidoglycan hydrolase-like protein with peptidoglycan-binding domain
MMKYDMGKTLNENKGVISEQEQPKGYRNIVVSYLNPGTNEKRLITGFKELSKAEDFVTLNNYFKQKHRGNDIQSVLNSELGTGDAQTAKEIQDHLKSIGVTMTFMPSVDKNGVVDDTIRIKVGSEGVKTKQDDKCLGKIKQYAVAGKRGLYKLGQTNYKFYSSGQYTSWVGNGPKSTGKWVCDSEGFIDLGGKKLGKTKTPFNWIQAPTEEEVKSGKKVLKSGMKGDFVIKVQEQLKSLGFDPKGTDGKFGKNTKNAVIGFQREVGLKPDDGVVGVDTYKVIFRQAAEPTNVASKEIKPTTPTLPTGQVQRSSPIPSVQTSHVDPKPTIKESMKKTLKTKLVEKTQEKENLLIETKIITNRFNLLSEGIVVETVEDQVQFIDDIIVEMNYMVSQGYSSQVINEGLFSMLGSLFGGSLKSVPAVFGEYIANWLTKTLGVPEGSFIQSSIVALVGNLNIADYDKFFTDCRFASNKIADSLIEGYLIQMQKRSDATSQGASGFIVSALRNAVSEYFLEDKDGIVQILQDKIGDFICPKLSKVSSAIADKADDIKDRAVA